eukprot:752456-Hanusia_phi.AAC.5
MAGYPFALQHEHLMRGAASGAQEPGHIRRHLRMSVGRRYLNSQLSKAQDVSRELRNAKMRKKP